MATTQTDGTREHILVCLSSSPTNERVVRTAIKMAKDCGGLLTAIYVKTSRKTELGSEDRERLSANIRLAENAGAVTVTTNGENIPERIAEYAILSGTTRIVIGFNNPSRRRNPFKPSITERLFDLVPGIDIHVIPDTENESFRSFREEREERRYPLVPTLKDALITAGLLAAATVIGTLFQKLGFTDANIITVYILCVLLTSILTRGYTCSAISSVMSVVLFNYYLTEPKHTLRTYGSGYPVTFAIMLLASVITGTLATRLKDQAKVSARDSFRTKLLFDTNRILQKAGNDIDILRATASQVSRLLEVDTVVFHAEDGKLAGGMHFVTGEESHPVAMGRGPEFDAAIWAFENRKSSDSEECPLKGREYLYIPVISDENVYGVLGVRAPSARPEIFENGMLQSLLGECGLALENHRNTKLREEAAVLAENEKLRANLLRSISHDLRTPLTSISGNADTLRKQWRKLDGETRESLLQDIEDDADWLRELVENLLSITRMGDGKVKLDVSDYVLGDILSDAVRHVDRRSERHRISVAYDDEPLLVRCDAKLIVQVIVNLVNNAIKYTPEGSEIRIIGGRMGDRARVTVTDNGTGIPDDLKDQVFEMFYTGDRRNGDSSRSLGLGLPLCKTIMDAHGEKLTLTDNIPHGCVFTFTLPLSEVDLNE